MLFNIRNRWGGGDDPVMLRPPKDRSTGNLTALIRGMLTELIEESEFLKRWKEHIIEMVDPADPEEFNFVKAISVMSSLTLVVLMTMDCLQAPRVMPISMGAEILIMIAIVIGATTVPVVTLVALSAGVIISATYVYQWCTIFELCTLYLGFHLVITLALCKTCEYDDLEHAIYGGMLGALSLVIMVIIAMCSMPVTTDLTIS